MIPAAEGAALREQEEAIARLLDGLARIDAERAALSTKRKPLGALVDRCTNYLKGLGLLDTPSNRVDIPATPNGRAT